MLRVAAPLISLVCLIFGTFHQVQVIIEQGYCKELSLPRTFLGIFSGAVWILYGLELNNVWMIVTNASGIVMNIVLASVIIYLRKRSL